MDQLNSNTVITERKRGQHLTAVERGEIQALNKLGFSNRAIARRLNCSPSTIGYELQRGTLAYSGRGRKSTYSARRGQKTYEAHRANCHRNRVDFNCEGFMSWLTKQILNHKWSIDICRGYALRNNLFPQEQIPSTKTLYNMLGQGRLPINVFNCPEILSRKKRKGHIPHKRLLGESIDARPVEVFNRSTFGHWEVDTVIGKKRKGEAAAFTIVERLTGYYVSIRIPGKYSEGVSSALDQLKLEYGSKFSSVFKTITTDNGSEFSELSSLNLGSTKVYYAHPYSSWERPVNERTNRMLRRFIPKGTSMNALDCDAIRSFSDEINALPRKRLGYATAEELFDQELDKIYKLNDA